MKMAKARQSRNYFLQTYVPGEIIVNALRAHEQTIKRYAYIYHDSDVWSESDPAVKDGEHVAGEPKTAHWHILLQLTCPLPESLVKSWFYDPWTNQNTNTQACTSKRACYRYLTHSDQPEKFQYSSLGIVSNDREYFDKISVDASREDTLYSAIDDLVLGCSWRDCIAEYGRDLIIHESQVSHIVDRIAFEEKAVTRIAELQEALAVLSAQVQTLSTERNELTKQVQSLRVQKANEYYTQKELEKIF